MGYPHYDLVERAYNELKAEGKIPMGDVEHDKGLITQRAGFYSYERDSTMGVLEKTSGNNYLGYSVDILIRTNGEYYDVVTDQDGQAVPVNGGPSNDPELIPRWRKPTAELAQVSPDEGGGEGEPVPPSDDLTARVEALEAHVKALEEAIAQGFRAHGPVNLPIVLEGLTLRAKGDIDVNVKPGQAAEPAPPSEGEGLNGAALWLWLRRHSTGDPEEPAEPEKPGPEKPGRPRYPKRS